MRGSFVTGLMLRAVFNYKTSSNFRSGCAAWNCSTKTNIYSVQALYNIIPFITDICLYFLSLTFRPLLE